MKIIIHFFPMRNLIYKIISNISGLLFDKSQLGDTCQSKTKCLNVSFMIHISTHIKNIVLRTLV